MKKMKSKSVLLMAICLLSLTIGVSSCKAWRTVTTTASYVQKNDSTGNASATITTKTVEEYQGVKKK